MGDTPKQNELLVPAKKAAHPSYQWDDRTKSVAGKKNSAPKKTTPTPHFFAKKLHDLGYVYALYGIFDGQIMAYNSLKYFADTFSISLNNWLLTPTGLITASIESTLFMSLAYLANTPKNNKYDVHTKAIQDTWFYYRNIIQELKNTNISVRNTLKIVTLIQGVNSNHFIMPFSLILGAASVLNQIWFQRLEHQRKTLIAQLKTLQVEVANLTTLDNEKPNLQPLACYYEKLANYERLAPTSFQQKQLYLSAGYRGVTNCLTYQIGLLTFISFTSPAFIPLAAFCIVATLATMVNHIYEVYENKRYLTLEALKIKLSLKQHELNFLDTQIASCVDRTALNKQYQSIFSELAKLNEQLDSQKPSAANKALNSLKKGLVVYNAVNRALVASLIFSSLPIELVLGCAIALIGMSLLVGFILYRLKLFASIKSLISKDWIDVTNAFFSGLKKGQKLINYTVIMSLFKVGLNKDLQDQPILLKIIAISLAAVSSIIFSLRSYARNFGGKSADNETYSSKELAVDEACLEDQASNTENTRETIPAPIDLDVVEEATVIYVEETASCSHTNLLNARDFEAFSKKNIANPTNNDNGKVRFFSYKEDYFSSNHVATSTPLVTT